MKTRWKGWAMALVGAGVLVGGCASTRAVHEARMEFQRAEQAGAERTAPYEYHAAKGYLEFAADEAEEYDAKAASTYAGKSKEFAAKALEKSQ
ncbi:MAG: hypothetical protein Kow0092_13760 [Deferrisomatales bacterium]